MPKAKKRLLQEWFLWAIRNEFDERECWTLLEDLAGSLSAKCLEGIYCDTYNEEHFDCNDALTTRTSGFS